MSSTLTSVPALIGRDITVAYNQRTVLQNISIEINVGDRVALVGPSGSGKTTLLSVLGGLLRPHTGAAWVAYPDDDRHLTPASAVAWVLQTTNGLGRRSVFDNVLLGTLTTAEPDDVRRARSIASLAAVGLSTSGHRQTRSLSGGELQRVSIARALAAARPFILADEPTGQLDRASTETVLDAMFNVDLLRAVVVATHDPQVWERCSRVYRIEDGTIAETRTQG